MGGGRPGPRRPAPDIRATAGGADDGGRRYGNPGGNPSPSLPDHRAQARRSRTHAGEGGGGRRDIRAVYAKAVRRLGKQLHALFAGTPAAAAGGGSVGPG